ncbi:MAG: hypothetical protein U0930_07300 [Pirellulales bacterium]
MQPFRPVTVIDEFFIANPAAMPPAFARFKSSAGCTIPTEK